MKNKTGRMFVVLTSVRHVRTSFLFPYLGRSVGQLKHGRHVDQRLTDLSIGAAHEAQRYRELKQQPVHQHQVTDCRLSRRC